MLLASAARSPDRGNQSSARLEVLIEDVRFLSHDVKVLTLASAGHGDLPAHAAGSHLDLFLREDLVRSYSLLPMENPRRYEVAVKLSPGSRGGSQYIHEKLVQGQILEVGRPRNNFPLADDAGHAILIAGGIGITPIYAMARSLAASERRWQLHYTFRVRKDAIFLSELEPFGKRCHFYCDESSGEPQLDLNRIVMEASPDSHLYCCGPRGMIDAFLALTRDRDEKYVHVELFQGEQEADRTGGYQVELLKTGKVIYVPPGIALIDALLEAGADVAFSCREGVCGSCETEVVSGQPDHRDSFLTETERKANRLMMVCCSGSLSDKLVLNL
jgi:ferredoxin-NADP reductase